MSLKLVRWSLCAAICLAEPGARAEVPTKASAMGSVVNTRHNMTQSFLGAGAAWMGWSRNDYGEVCVYCHTPHGANQNITAPLWNRTFKATNYTTYGQLGSSTLTQTVTQPGASSLVCLSCHDGQTAVDSIINMPGSGRYGASQPTSQNDSFLDSWPGGPGSQFNGGHGTLEISAAAFSANGACQACHSISGDQHDPSTTPPFDAFYIGTDLRNDHPVGVTFPVGDPDFRAGSIDRGAIKFFDGNGNGLADKNEVRFYNTGNGYEVECGSCHDPHGVPEAGPGTKFAATFLRVPNTNSALCLTCHSK